MVLFMILGIVVLITIAVLGFLFFMLNKEGQKKEEAVPVTDMAQLKKELSNQLFEPNELKVVTKNDEIIPVYQPKIEMPMQEETLPLKEDVKPSPEDEAYKKRAQHLEDELLAISKKATGQSDEAQQLIESLTEENKALKSQQIDLEHAKQKLEELQGESSNLKIENIGLQTQLETTNAKVRLLEEEMIAVKMQMGNEISHANATVSELSREKEALLSAPKPPDPSEELQQELQALKIEYARLLQKCDELEKNQVTPPKADPDEALRQEVESLKYELIKAKAQSSGLERVSFNYKNQLEDFFKKINAVQVTNDHLSQVKNRLEGMIEEVKSQNDDLVKKDHLAQFELEKNRSRLVDLEREYQELKSRIQQQSQQ